MSEGHPWPLSLWHMTPMDHVEQLGTPGSVESEASSRKRKTPDYCGSDEDPDLDLKRLRIRSLSHGEISAQMRLQKDIEEIRDHPIDGMGINVEKNLAEPLSLFVLVVLDEVMGLDGTKRSFGFVYKVPERYPFNAPTMRLCDASVRAHPMLNPDRTIRLPILQGNWNCCCGLRMVLLELHELIKAG